MTRRESQDQRETDKKTNFWNENIIYLILTSMIFISILFLFFLDLGKRKDFTKKLNFRKIIFNLEVKSESDYKEITMTPAFSQQKMSEICYDSKIYSSGFGHQIIAISYLFKKHGENLKIFTPTKSVHSNIHNYHYSFIKDSMLIPRENYHLCKEVTSVYEKFRNLMTLSRTKEFIKEGIGNFFENGTKLNEGFCKTMFHFDMEKLLKEKGNNNVGVKIRVRDIRWDERASRNLGLGDYKAQMQRIHSLSERTVFFVMSDIQIPKNYFPQEMNIVYLEDPSIFESVVTPPSRLFCNLHFLGSLHYLITNSHSNIHSLMVAMALSHNNVNQLVYDVFSSTEFNILNEIHDLQ